jgi:hypothetical protein
MSTFPTKFAECVLNNDFPPMSNEEMAAIEWCKFVDGVKIFPKLSVHIYLHREVFERNQHVKECARRAKQGQDHLNELNNTLTSAALAFSDPIINPEQKRLMPPQAMHNAPYDITGGTAIGVIPVSSGQKRKKGERVPDVEVRNRRTCARCKEFGGNDWELLKYNCDGRYRSRDRCNHFDKDG